jgi:hypothetical protein
MIMRRFMCAKVRMSSPVIEALCKLESRAVILKISPRHVQLIFHDIISDRINLFPKNQLYGVEN